MRTLLVLPILNTKTAKRENSFQLLSFNVMLMNVTKKSEKNITLKN